MVDTDVLKDHSGSCVEKTEASGEPAAMKVAWEVRRRVVGNVPDIG
jgi:hypothetical protein